VQQQLLQYQQSLEAGAAGTPGSTPKPWKVEWVELKLKLYYIDRDSDQELPGISTAFADSAFSAAAAKADTLRKRLRTLERKPPDGTVLPLPEVGHVPFTTPRSPGRPPPPPPPRGHVRPAPPSTWSLPHMQLPCTPRKP
jgi:hypothetical protein